MIRRTTAMARWRRRRMGPATRDILSRSRFDLLDSLDTLLVIPGSAVRTRNDQEGVRTAETIKQALIPPRL
ncbi:hypothetical protein VQ03_21270, partial [Methylobacterium tarhaniae]